MNLDASPVREYLASSMIARIATLSPKGEPNITPLWFVRDQERLYMTTREGSPAVRNIAERPDVVLLFDSERDALRHQILRLRGRAVFRTGRGIMWRAVLRQLPKYRVSPAALRNLLSHAGKAITMARYYGERAAQGGVIEVTPERAEFLPRYRTSS